METLEQYNLRMDELLKNKNCSGISCPNCKTEMQYSSRGFYLSSPMQADIKCFLCGYETRIRVVST